jgi:hypothetical protein
MKKIGVFLIILGAVLMLPIYMMETQLIIWMGIRSFQAFSVLPFFVAAIGVIVLCFGLAPIVKARLAAKSEIRQKEEEKLTESMATLSYSAASYDPADIRRRLKKLKEQRPDLKNALTKCEAQMDAMDRRQAKLKELLDINEAEYLRATESLLDEVEQFICKNFRKVINRGIVSDLEDDDIFAQDEKYSTYSELIEAVLSGNQTELDNIKRFLADMADLVSAQNDNSEITLQAWMQVIRDSLKKEEI